MSESVSLIRDDIYFICSHVKRYPHSLAFRVQPTRLLLSMTGQKRMREAGEGTEAT